MTMIKLANSSNEYEDNKIKNRRRLATIQTLGFSHPKSNITQFKNWLM